MPVLTNPASQSRCPHRRIRNQAGKKTGNGAVSVPRAHQAEACLVRIDELHGEGGLAFVREVCRSIPASDRKNVSIGPILAYLRPS